MAIPHCAVTTETCAGVSTPATVALLFVVDEEDDPPPQAVSASRLKIDKSILKVFIEYLRKRHWL
jgi:hypothetical protein